MTTPYEEYRRRTKYNRDTGLINNVYYYPYDITYCGACGKPWSLPGICCIEEHQKQCCEEGLHCSLCVKDLEHNSLDYIFQRPISMPINKSIFMSHKALCLKRDSKWFILKLLPGYIYNPDNESPIIEFNLSNTLLISLFCKHYVDIFS